MYNWNAKRMAFIVLLPFVISAFLLVGIADAESIFLIDTYSYQAPVEHLSMDFAGTHVEYDAERVDAAVLAKAIELPREYDQSLVIDLKNLPVTVRDGETGDERAADVGFDVSGSQDGRATGQAELHVGLRTDVVEFTNFELLFDDDGRFKGLLLLGHSTIDGQPSEVIANVEVQFDGVQAPFLTDVLYPVQ